MTSRILRCVHGQPVAAADGLGYGKCNGPAVLPEPDPEGAEPRTSPGQYDEPGADPRDTAWWQR